MRVNKLAIPILLGIFFSLLFTQNASAEIKVTPPLNWQPAPFNNSTGMVWIQNSTKSLFGILKFEPSFPIFLVGPIMSQFFADKGVLDSVDQTSFGRSNYGYRYFLNFPSNSEMLKSNSSQGPEAGIFSIFPDVYDVPFRGMFILTEKQGDLYAIALFSPKDNFDFLFEQIKSTIDSIELSNSTTLTSQTNQ